jgi:hypothetical protein
MVEELAIYIVASFKALAPYSSGFTVKNQEKCLST